MSSPTTTSGTVVVEEVDGLRLHLSSESNTGYTGVYQRGPTGRFYTLWSGGRSGRTLGLGTYGSAREAATAYARHAALSEGEQQAVEARRARKPAAAPERRARQPAAAPGAPGPVRCSARTQPGHRWTPHAAD